MSPYRENAKRAPRTFRVTWWMKFVVGTLLGERARIRRERRRREEREEQARIHARLAHWEGVPIDRYRALLNARAQELGLYLNDEGFLVDARGQRVQYVRAPIAPPDLVGVDE